MTATIKTSNTKTQVSVTVKFASGADVKFRISMSRLSITFTMTADMDKEACRAIVRTKGSAFMKHAEVLMDNMSAVDLIMKMKDQLQGVQTFAEVFDRMSKM